ncbi:hypothetical protein [Amycolatopsis acididurans]|nr:hypothetical protein [Amycolatopsis acididurans]
MSNALMGLVWLVIVGCLTVAVPVLGVLTLLGSAAIAMKVARS